MQYGDFIQFQLKDSQHEQLHGFAQICLSSRIVCSVGFVGVDWMKPILSLMENSLWNTEAGALCLLLSTDERSI